MGEFFDWLEKLAKEPVGLLFVFGASSLLWVGLLRRLVKRGMIYLKAIPSWWRQIRTAVIWHFRKPQLTMLDLEDLKENRENNRLEYRLPLKVKATNRDNGVAVVFLGNLTATLIQKRGVTFRFTLQAPSTPELNFAVKDEQCERTMELLYQGPVSEFWTNLPIDLFKRYIIELSSVSAGIGATSDAPSGHNQTKQMRSRQ